MVTSSHNDPFGLKRGFNEGTVSILVKKTADYAVPVSEISKFFCEASYCPVLLSIQMID
jgi:hypothetical protein